MLTKKFHILVFTAKLSLFKRIGISSETDFQETRVSLCFGFKAFPNSVSAV
jgi:hypothetical protein